MRFATILAALALAGCASDAAIDDPVFKAGYEAGCGMAHSSREVRAAMTKGQPELYRCGFQSGFSVCGGGREVGR